jgi:hypothetical protein
MFVVVAQDEQINRLIACLAHNGFSRISPPNLLNENFFGKYP